MASKRRRRKSSQKQGLLATLRNPDKIRIAYMIAGLALVFGGSLGFGSGKCSNNGPISNIPQGDAPIVAKIQDKEITWEEFLKEYESARTRSEASSQAVMHPPEWEASIQYTALRQMIDMEYFDIKAEESGIEVSEEDIEAQVLAMRDRLLPVTAVDEERSILDRISDSLKSVKEDKAFEQALKEKIDPTLTLVRLRQNIRQYLLAQEYVSQLTAEKDAEIMSELTDKANGITVEINEKAVDREFAQPFGEAATEYSVHEASKQLGGIILGLKRTGTGVPQIVIDRAFDLPVGEISQPLTVLDPAYRGVWLLMVMSKIEASGEEWDAQREPIRARLLEEKRARIEAGEEEMPEDENITVSDDEVRDDYEEATIRVIQLGAEDSMARVSEAVREDQANMDIFIYSPQIRAMHHIYSNEWVLAGADYAEALQDMFDRYKDEPDSQDAIDLGESQLRYMISNLWATRAMQAESQWFQDIWATFQADPEAFGGAFPELPEKIRMEQQGYFALASKNLSRAIELEEKQMEIEVRDPFYHWQRAQIDVAREQLTERAIADLDIAHTYSNEDFDLEQRVLSVLNQAIALDNQALETAGGVRPDTWTDPVFPEDELGLTLEQLDQPFIDRIDQVTVEYGKESEAVSLTTTPKTEEPAKEAAPETELDNEVDLSGVEVEGEVMDTTGESEAGSVVEPEQIDADSVEIPDWVPSIPIMESNGPLTEELRGRLDDLQVIVQAVVDRLTAERQAQQAQQQAFQNQQVQNLPINEPESDGTAEGTNLLDEEGGE